MSLPATPSSMMTDLRALPRAVWVLFAGTFINRFGTFVWPFLTIYLTRQGYSPIDVSYAVSAFGLGALAGGLTGGWLADHIGRRHTIVLGTFSSAISFSLLYTAHGLGTVIACTLLAGLTSGSYPPAMSALMADLVPPERRVRAYSAIRLAANAGFACGAATGGLLANYSFFWLFAGDALTTALYGLIALLWLPQGLRTSAATRAPWGEALATMARDRAFHALWAAAFLSAIVYSQYGSTYSLNITQHRFTLDLFGKHLAPESVYGVVIAWNGLLIMLTELPLTSLTLRYDPRRAMAVGYVLVGIGFGLNAWASSIFELYIAMTIFTVGEMVSAPMASAFVAQLSPERMRGRYMGTLGLAWNSAAIVGPQFGFRVFERNPNAVWFGCAVIGLAAAATTLLARRPAPLVEEGAATDKTPEPDTTAA